MDVSLRELEELARAAGLTGEGLGASAEWAALDREFGDPPGSGSRPRDGPAPADRQQIILAELVDALQHASRLVPQLRDTRAPDRDRQRLAVKDRVQKLEHLQQRMQALHTRVVERLDQLRRELAALEANSPAEHRGV